ncbi:MAG: NUDIX hydrolase [Candidatus Saccharimonadales bacterium]
MKLSYCPQCAAPLTKQNATNYICQNGHNYYNNPRAAVAIILIKNSHILFAKRAREPQKNKYDFPGGFVNYGEAPSRAAHRETFEETGLKLNQLKLLDAQLNFYQTNVCTSDFIYICQDFSGRLQPQDDVAALEWHELAFMQSPNFAWNYPGLYEKLQKIIAKKTTKL